MSGTVIRWFERTFRTDARYVLGGGFWLTFGQIVSAGSAFILSIAFANLLPPETYGVYRYILAAAALMAIPTLAGMQTALTTATVLGRSASYFPMFQSRLRWGSLGAAGGLIVASYYLWSGNTLLAAAFAVAALILPFSESLTLYDAILQGEKDFRRSTIYRASAQVAAVIALVGALVVSKNLIVIIAVYGIVWTIARAIATRFTLKHYPPTGSDDQAAETYGKHLSAMSILTAVAAQFDKILIFHFLGAAELAVYALALAVPDQAKVVFRNIGVLTLPKFSSKQGRDIVASISEKLAPFFLVLGLTVLGYGIIAPWLYGFLFPAYQAAVPYSILYALVLLLVPKVFYRVAFEAKRRSRELYTFQVTSAVARLIILYLLIAQFGLLGAIIANILSELVTYVILVYLFRRSGLANE